MPKLTKQKEKKVKPIVVWAVCFALNRKCLSGDIPTFQTRAKAKQYIKELHQKIGGFEDDHHIVKVSVTHL